MRSPVIWKWGFVLLAMTPAMSQTAVNITGKVTDSAGASIADATVKLEMLGYSATTSSTGAFSLTGSGTGMDPNWNSKSRGLSLREGRLWLESPFQSAASVVVLGPQGEVYGRSEIASPSEELSFSLPQVPTGLCFISITIDGKKSLLRALSVNGVLRSVGAGSPSLQGSGPLAKAAATTIYDVITVTKSGFQKGYVSVTSSDSSGVTIKLLKEGSTKFSFFVVSMKAIVEQSGKADGFGGDLRFGETGTVAGLRGADKICRTVAEKSLPGSSVKGWRAFLSATAGVDGKQVDAINRVGPGPWYDRLGRLLAPTKADLVNVRPANGDVAIQLDLPNEDGVPNHRPDPTKPADDNHHMMTGSSTTGTLKSATSTCKDWTVAEANSDHGQPGVGFAWPRGGRVSNQGSHWMSTYDAHGCGRGFGIVENGPGNPSILTVGDGGGYGGFYCFALNP